MKPTIAGTYSIGQRMNASFPTHLHSTLQRALLSLAAGSLAVISLAGSVWAAPTTAAQGAPLLNLRAVEDSLKADYLQRQWQRLSRRADRDSLIAAELIGWQLTPAYARTAGQTTLQRHLLGDFGNDPLALFVLALGCQAQRPTCSSHEYYDSLVRAAPDNAVHWLMLPDASPPTTEQLHPAASASVADSHLPELMRILRAALEGGPMLSASANVNAETLALRMRRDSVDAIPLPVLAGIGPVCMAPSEEHRADCIELGRKLLSDQSGAILPRMVGSAMVRRLLKGTPEAAAATERRREYVWLSETLPDDARSDESVQRDVASLGEWEAWLRLADRVGAPRTPPAGWVPADPRLMQLWEDRKPPAAK
jgi:hypothetical protein